MTIDERFIKYIGVDSMSDPYSKTYPSTSIQLDFADMMVKDLKEIGVTDAAKDKYGLVYGHINIGKEKTIGLIAHMDTAPTIQGGIKHPKLIKKYDGSPIVLNDKFTMTTDRFLALKYVIGDDLLVTDGDHLLGGDDKAGVAIIFEFAQYFIAHKNEFNYNLAICFTPDEEVGGGWKHFDVLKMNADIGYTLDGESCYEANHENFNAASATLDIKGVGVHPGAAKGLMENAVSIACEFQSKLPANEVPEKTEGYEGYYHLTSMNGDIENAHMEYILRDHDHKKLEEKKAMLKKVCAELQKEHAKATFDLKIEDDYRNMADYFIDHPEAIEMINKAYLAKRMKLSHVAIRGGTDGAMITYMGLPCPNLGTGDFNPHGRFEFVSLTQMHIMVDVLKELFKVQ